MENLYIVKGYWYSYSDEYGNKEVQQGRYIVSAESAESALRYFTKGEEDWKNYKDSEESELLIGAYNEKAAGVIENTFRIEVLPLKPDIVVIE